jgi:GR25 family glycosyltransferase involved in LPS biosynthesis
MKLTKHDKAIVILQALYNNANQEKIIASIKDNLYNKRLYNNYIKMPMADLNDSYNLAITVINQRIHESMGNK